MSISDPTLGEITMFGAPWAPRNWALCNGQLLPISSNSALFSILGTTYGGDGRTTFGLPDLRGRVAKHAGTGPGLTPVRLGEKNGHEQVALSTLNLPSHSHPHTHTATVHAEARMADEATPADNVFALAGANIYHDVDDSREDVLMHSNTVTLSTDSSNTGGNIPFDITNPYQAVSFIIALYGYYPSRS